MGQSLGSCCRDRFEDKYEQDESERKVPTSPMEPTTQPRSPSPSMPWSGWEVVSEEGTEISLENWHSQVNDVLRTGFLNSEANNEWAVGRKRFASCRSEGVLSQFKVSVESLPLGLNVGVGDEELKEGVITKVNEDSAGDALGIKVFDKIISVKRGNVEKNWVSVWKEWTFEAGDEITFARAHYRHSKANNMYGVGRKRFASCSSDGVLARRPQTQGSFVYLPTGQPRR